MPVGIRMGLVFKETQIITKYDLQSRRVGSSIADSENQSDQWINY